MNISKFPQLTEISLSMRPILHPMFQRLPDGISEFTFAGLYLFRQKYNYRVALLEDRLIITGNKDGTSFFMLPFGMPDWDDLDRLFQQFGCLKCVPEEQIPKFIERGYSVVEDRDNFDYLYLRAELAELTGRKFHKKRNLIKAFVGQHNFEGRPLLEEHVPDALQVLDMWRSNRDSPGDYNAAREALLKSEELQLCGGIYYVEKKPVAYSLGEELMLGDSFVTHFEKAEDGYKGLWQFMNQAFASILPDIYTTINREQDLGEPGLRKAKLSYKPWGFVKKYRVCKKESDPK